MGSWTQLLRHTSYGVLSGFVTAGLFISVLAFAPQTALAAGECTVQQLTDGVGEFYAVPAISGSGTQIAFPSDGDLVPGSNPDAEFQIFLLDTALGTLSQLTPDTDLHSDRVAINADGTKVVFSSFGLPSPPSQLFLHDAASGDLTQITTTGGFASTIDDSGTRIAYSRNQTVFLLDLVSGTTVQITDSFGPFALSSSPVISPDGTHVLFSSSADLIVGQNSDHNAEVFLFDAEQASLTQVTQTSGAGIFNLPGSLSGDGTRAVFESQADLLPGGNPDGGFEVFLFEPATGFLRQLTNSTTFSGSRFPAISADGRRVVFASAEDHLPPKNADGSFEAFVLDVSTGGLTQATDFLGGQQFSVSIDSEATRIVLSGNGNPVEGTNADRSFEIFLATCSFVADSDGDGVTDDLDVCPDTVRPEASLPSVRLGVNRWALMGDDRIFDTTAPRGRGPKRSYSIDDTGGCSCEQIVDRLSLGNGHVRFGCSISAMDDWVALVNP